MDTKRLPFCHQKFVAKTDTKGETSKLAFSDSRAPESLLFIFIVRLYFPFTASVEEEKSRGLSTVILRAKKYFSGEIIFGLDSLVSLKEILLEEESYGIKNPKCLS